MPRQENTKEKILQCAFELFGKPRISEVSLSEIAAATGISKTAIFRHFKNKEDLLDTMRQRFFSAMAEMFKEIETIQKPYDLNGVAKTVRCVFEFNERYPNYLSYYLQESFTDELLSEGSNIIMLDSGIRYFNEELFKDKKNYVPHNLISTFFEQTLLVYLWLAQKDDHANVGILDQEKYKDCVANLIYSGLGRKKNPISPERKKELDEICKITLDTDEKSNRFLNALVKLVQDRGSARITVERIADAVGMAKSSVYAFFANKRDYLINMLIQETERVNSIIQEKCSHAKNSDEALYAIMRTQANYFALRPQVLMLHGYFIFQEAALADQDIKKFHKRTLGAIIDTVVKPTMPQTFDFPVRENSILYIKWISELTVGYMLMGTKHKFPPEWLDFYVSTIFEMIECGVKIAYHHNGEKRV